MLILCMFHTPYSIMYIESKAVAWLLYVSTFTHERQKHKIKVKQKQRLSEVMTQASGMKMMDVNIYRDETMQ